MYRWANVHVCQSHNLLRICVYSNKFLTFWSWLLIIKLIIKFDDRPFGACGHLNLLQFFCTCHGKMAPWILIQWMTVPVLCIGSLLMMDELTDGYLGLEYRWYSGTCWEYLQKNSNFQLWQNSSIWGSKLKVNNPYTNGHLKYVHPCQEKENRIENKPSNKIK